eukprot:CAMPEP_0170538104 /NCGR_PEP_ID=MMETSP0209-20121228/103112_1 /TAXON_ID=665100 ORGANISM="Litonotus pictus, Strain P1" /NCGR_SAMPLE_ID=MMETSP0209 /ASSEMBLY_ACC=CAM_ASM_000301 /LENGTH=992 /DNA_ID=CAMNT_0010839733 /DNA_START=1261 /DNA_END=4237 /DNA_ORIENTATION=+
MLNHKLRRLNKKINEYSDLWKQTNSTEYNQKSSKGIKERPKKRSFTGAKENNLKEEIISEDENKKEEERTGLEPLQGNSLQDIIDEEKFKEDVEKMLEDIISKNDLEIAGLIHFKDVKRKLVKLTKNILNIEKQKRIKLEKDQAEKKKKVIEGNLEEPKLLSNSENNPNIGILPTINSKKNTRLPIENLSDEEIEVNDYAEEDVLLLERKNKVDGFKKKLKEQLEKRLREEIKTLQEAQVCTDKLMLYKDPSYGLSTALQKFSELYLQYVEVRPDCLCFSDEIILNYIFGKSKETITLIQLESVYLRQIINNGGVINGVKIGESGKDKSIKESKEANNEYNDKDFYFDENYVNSEGDGSIKEESKNRPLTNEENIDKGKEKNKNADSENIETKETKLGRLEKLKKLNPLMNTQLIKNSIYDFLHGLRDPILLIDLIKTKDLVTLINYNIIAKTTHSGFQEEEIETLKLEQTRMNREIKRNSLLNSKRESSGKNNIPIKDSNNTEEKEPENKKDKSQENHKEYTELNKANPKREETQGILELLFFALYSNVEYLLIFSFFMNALWTRVILELLFFALYSNVEYLLIFSFFMNCIMDSSLISLVYPLLYFGYGLVEYPFPSKTFWKVLIKYSSCTLIVKLIFQLPLFCGYPVLSIFNVFGKEYCENFNLTTQELTESTEYLIGLRKYTGEYSYPKNIGLFKGIFWDVVILSLLLTQRSFLKAKGIWNFIDINNKYTHSPIFKEKRTKSQEEDKHGEYDSEEDYEPVSEIKKEKVDKEDKYMDGRGKSFGKNELKKDRSSIKKDSVTKVKGSSSNGDDILSSKSDRGKSRGNKSSQQSQTKSLQSSQSKSSLSDEMNSIYSGRIDTSNREKSKMNVASNDNEDSDKDQDDIKLLTNTPLDSKEAGKSKEDTNQKSKRKPESPIMNFFSRLMPELFFNKDHEIVYKPGKDYYPHSFGSLLILLIYTLFNFSSMTGKSGQSILDSLDKQQFSKELVW